MRPPMGPGRPPPNNGPMNAHTSIYLVDDSAAIRSRLADMVGRIEGVRVVGVYGLAVWVFQMFAGPPTG